MAKLESLYYIMVRERKACNLAAQEQLNKQQWASTKYSALIERTGFMPNEVFTSCDWRQIIQKLLKEQGELKIDLNILNAAVKAREEDENKKKLQSLAVVVMDTTLKKEKDCQEELDQEVHVQWSYRRPSYFFVVWFTPHRWHFISLLADHSHDHRDDKIQKTKIGRDSMCRERAGSEHATVSGEEALKGGFWNVQPILWRDHVGAGLLLLAIHVCVYLNIRFASLGFCSA